MSKVAELLAGIEQALSELVAISEKASGSDSLAGIEQALSDVVAALERDKRTDMQGIIGAISSLKFAVQAAPVVVNVSPEIRAVLESPLPQAFQPLTLKVNRTAYLNLIDTIDIFAKV